MSEQSKQSPLNLEDSLFPSFKIDTNELIKLAKHIKGKCITNLGLNSRESDKRPAEELAYSILDTVIKVANICGNYTQKRPNLVLISELLLFNPSPIIIAPSCPDYSYNSEGKYTFEGLGSDVPLLAQKQITFLKEIREIIPNCRPIILLADAESQDLEICQKVGCDKNEFDRLVLESLDKTKNFLYNSEIDVELMTRFIPNLLTSEKTHQETLKSDNFQKRIEYETEQRKAMYQIINPELDYKEMKFRTIKTASQYLALGQFANENGYLVANHTTTNLPYYGLSKAAILHNPLKIY